MTDEAGTIQETVEETAEETTGTTTEEETEERDLIDDLIDDLNDGVDGITFDRDVLDTNRPGDWGAVELSGQDDSEWADGQLIDQVLTVDVWVCLSDRGSWPKRQVQSVLKAFCAEIQAGWRFVNRAWLYDLDKAMWHWIVTIDGPLAMELAGATEDDETDELPFTDPEEDPETYTDEDDPEWPETDPEDGGD